jgi:hypothetical protein
MPSITPSHLRRLTVTILIGGVILLPAFLGPAPAQDDGPARPATATAL